MADNYLEKHREDYERRKAYYLGKKKSHLPKSFQLRSKGVGSEYAETDSEIQDKSNILTKYSTLT